mgnify:CR=1 FL=1
MAIPAELRERVETWIADDPDPEGRAELETLLQAGDREGLEARFSGNLEFGTAGCRALMGAGPSRFNRRNVLLLTAACVRYLQRTLPAAAQRGICVAYDARRGGARFAQDVIEVASAAGFRVAEFAAPLPTPLLAYASRKLNCSAAVMITASHNPRDYNGYKLYGAEGYQITPPSDGEIVAERDRVESVASIARLPIEEGRTLGLVRRLEEDFFDDYVAALREIAPPRSSPLRIAYSALHGVGAAWIRRLLVEGGFRNFDALPSQNDPDGSFPTVPSPNPEEAEALKELFALGRERKAELLLATDPDADRLALALPDVEAEEGFRLLHGNQVGALLADYRLSKMDDPAQAFVLSSIVSSPLAGQIARHYDAHWEPTLTGFKWMAKRALELQASGKRFAFAYEEAIGYLVSPIVRDKDALSAALVVAEMVDVYREQGRTLWQVLDGIAARHGVYLSHPITLKHDADESRDSDGWLDALFAAPPASLGGISVKSARDFRQGSEIQTPQGKVFLPPTTLLELDLEGGHRVMLRPSGTEPKTKVYIDVHVPCTAATLAEAKVEAQNTLQRIVAALRALLQPA